MSLSYETSDAPHVTVVSGSGDLTVVGSEQPGLAVLGVEDRIKVERQGESFTITADDDCDIHCPLKTSVTIKQVNGDLRVQGLGGPLAIEAVNGDVELRDVGPTSLRLVRGDFEVRGVKGELRVESVSGDAKVRQASGAVALKSVRGDLAARDLEGGAVVEQVGGDVSLSTALAKGASYRFQARGDISAKVEASDGARLTLEGGDIHCRLPLQFSERSSRRVVGTLGEGSAELTLQAKGDLSVSERGESWGPAGEAQWESQMDAWTQQFEAQMADMQRKLEERLANIPFVESDKIARRAQEAADRARRQAERAAERARARAERASHKHGHRGVGFHVSWPSSPQSPKPGGEPVSDAERIAILKMVADKKITADEASKLLSALEGEA
jgi:hypothetical protein